MPSLPGWIACALLSGLLLPASPVTAQTFSYTVEIQAPDDIAGVLRDNLDIVSWSQREDVSEEQLRQLAKTAPDQVRSLLATEGYFSPGVKIRIDRSQPVWVVNLVVEPGQPTRVVSVDFRITGDITNDPERDERVQRARQAFVLEEGAVFRQRDWAAGKEAAVHSLHRKRYAAARVVSSRAEIDPQALQARLSVEIDSGPPFRFGQIEVNGLQRYPVRIVRNLSPIKPGDTYDEEQLLRFQKRLLASGRFASAVVFAGNDPEQANATPIFVNIVESKARRVELGVGYSTDRGPRGVARYTDQNAFDRALQFDARLRIDKVSEELSSGLLLPRNRKGWRYGVEGKYEQQDVQNEVRTDWSVTGSHTYLVEEYRSQQSLQLLAENRRLLDGSEDNVLALYLAQNWNWNALDDILAPREGYFVSLEVGGASHEIVSDATFGRVLGKGSYFIPVKTFGTVALRLEAGSVIADSRNDIPSAYLFRTGGDTTVRGYEFESLGIEQGGAIVGGRYLLVGSVEYVHWIRPNWGAAVFYDLGNAVDDTSEYEAVAGYGIGARWYSPVGALSFDVAYGEEVDEYRIHFTAGFVFR